jgi:hypothetical protein
MDFGNSLPACQAIGTSLVGLELLFGRFVELWRRVVRIVLLSYIIDLCKRGLKKRLKNIVMMAAFRMPDCGEQFTQ